MRMPHKMFLRMFFIRTFTFLSLVTVVPAKRWNLLLKKNISLFSLLRHPYDHYNSLSFLQCRPAAEQYETTTAMICTIRGGDADNTDDVDDILEDNLEEKEKQEVPDSQTNLILNPVAEEELEEILSTSTISSSSAVSLTQQQESSSFKAKKQMFLNKISLVSTILSRSGEATVEPATKSHHDGVALLPEESIENPEDDDEITLQSDLTRPGRQFCIVTTATIPWFTGTAINPLLRAAYLNAMARNINQNATISSTNPKEMEPMSDGTYRTQSLPFSSSSSHVTLMIPWLELEADRQELYGNKFNFTSPEDQEVYIRNWLRHEASMPEEADPKTGIQIVFYNARFHPGLKSIFAMGDMLSLIPDEQADVVILEEPEHLNWYRAPGKGWTQKFKFVIGIIHTNYVEYVSGHYSGLWTAPATKLMSSAMIRAYCHVVIKLSDTLQTFAEEKEKTVNVHGVRQEFLQEGIRRVASMNYNRSHHHDGSGSSSGILYPTVASNHSASNTTTSSLSTSKDICNAMDITPTDASDDEAQVYFIGKILWTKGLDIMLDLQSYYKQCTGNYFPIDIYGSGPEEKEIKRAFHGRSFTSEWKATTTTTTTTLSSARNSRVTQHTKFGPQNANNTSDQMLMEEKNSTTFSTHVAKLSRPLKNVKESLDDIELPKSFHEWRRTPIPAKFKGRVDHTSVKYPKIFVNPSISEVLCTTTMEALAMNKFVIIPLHPSNTFFLQFDNCLAYRNKFEFAANLHWALSRDPYPLSPDQQRVLTWEMATERLVKAVAITRKEAKERQKLGTSKLDDRIAWFHNQLGDGYKGDFVRKILGAGPASDQYAYLSKQQRQEDSNDDDVLSTKFVKSSFTEAIRETLANAFPLWAHSQTEAES